MPTQKTEPKDCMKPHVNVAGVQVTTKQGNTTNVWSPLNQLISTGAFVKSSKYKRQGMEAPLLWPTISFDAVSPDGKKLFQGNDWNSGSPVPAAYPKIFHQDGLPQHI